MCHPSLPNAREAETIRWRTHHESLRHVRAHERHRAAFIEDLDEDAVAVGHATYPAGVACETFSQGYGHAHSKQSRSTGRILQLQLP